MAQIQDQRIAWAAQVVSLPRDPSIVYAGTIVRHRLFEEPAVIHTMPSVITPIMQKTEESQTDLLKRILQQVSKRGDNPMPQMMGQQIRHAV